VLEPGLYSERQKKNDWDIRIYYIGGPERRKYTRIDGRFNPEAPEVGFGYFSSKEITPVLKKAVGSFNNEERKNNFKIFYKLVKEQAAGVPLYYDAVFVVAKPFVKGIEYISSEPRFDKAYVDKK
jgi:ABC-type transport system substrate-binding protein